MSKKIFNGKKLKNARVYRGKTIDVLANETKINKKDILAFESDKYKPTLENEMKLANALNFPKDYFSQSDDNNVVVENTHIRTESTLPRVDDIAFKEKLVMTHRLLKFIQGYISFPEMNLPNNLNKNDDIEDLAEKVRNYFNLGDGPIGNMVSLLEINGIFISATNIDKKGALAFSQKQSIDKESRYFISLGNDRKSAPIRNYDLAYELAYIVSTETNIQSKKFSKDEFACAFLMPRESFLTDLEGVHELEDYIELKKKWIVPVWSMILRGYQLGKVSYKKYMYLMNEMDKKGWSKKEPLDDNIKSTNPMLLKKSFDMLIESKIMNEGLFMNNLANYGLSIYPKDVEELLGLKEGTLSKNINKNNQDNVRTVNFRK
ncbi:XRE family transcriptional regulator [Paraclostridium sordellii]|uniref:XRE family transcriptional regulator n=2 Tax=Paraclostridium sordellii TaxID=1505 RepID=UPI0005E50ED0|nr:XRE family transcriptional regulator [Paeniclostridium sordellii]MDU4413725.1 XRE family transcriptional regulator [Paeniclostridium sordellii]MVO75709.1 transcriptional regulator [Paeniclostridium sordellii]CEN84301.1 HTH-type transcriptional regulator [[Clostridium] sordellii] [Paeniclostridium sordellii]CEO11789.1 HTH-type transcriptional regulator [[Clostridium] sordellii] [Paeniclostridium sordellii]CEO28998.1 HTH-type transcriptional regulator [[Clostridium] sordellii] [Paeniclostridi